tara:strand:+ start:7032 stop:8330 length:1299 start_codon:yes stop_codon:yes gene_type:complete
MTIPSNSELNMYDGTPFSNTDWDNNWNQAITWLTSANYEVNFSKVTASSFVGLPENSFTLTTGEDISAGNVIRISGGLAYKATNANAAGITSVVGIATITASSGASVTIDNSYYDEFSLLTVGGIYYVGLDGAITITKPATNILQVGIAVTASRLNIEINEESKIQNSFTLTTGENIAAGDIIRISGGNAFKATNANAAGITAVVGIAESTVTIGNPLTVLTSYYNAFSALTVASIYYVGVDGAITASKPSWGMEIGTAVSASRININIKPARYTSVIDKISFYAKNGGFDTTVQQDMSLTVWNVYSIDFPTIWATQPIIDGSHKVYLRFQISGAASAGDGFRLYITDDSNNTLFDTGDNIISNLSRSAIYYWDIANLGTTTLNIGSNPLNGITADSTDSSARWKIRARRTDGSTTSGEYYIRSIEFVLVQQ